MKKALPWWEPIVPEQALEGVEEKNHTFKIGPLVFLTGWSGRSQSGVRIAQTARRHRKVTVLPLEHVDDVHPAEVIASVGHCWMCASLSIFKAAIRRNSIENGSIRDISGAPG